MKASQNDVERDFLDALDRLARGAPRSATLKTRVAKGTLRISFSSVAEEAGRSRTLIGTKKCPYPAVRDRILAMTACTDPSVPAVQPPGRRVQEIIARLRDEIAILKSEKAALATQALEAANAARHLEKVVERMKRDQRRGDARASKNNSDKVALPSDSSVVPFKRT